MPSANQTIRHIFDGGWATDFGSSAEVTAGPDGLIRIPFLTESLNTFYELDGATHKIGGTLRMNTTAAGSGAEVIGLYDFWRGTGGGSGAQKLVANYSTIIGVANLDATSFTDTVTGLTDGQAMSYETFDDLLIISSYHSTEGPWSYDQTTMGALAGTPPEFSFSATHKNRLWAAGVPATPSRLFYSTFVDPEDWTSKGSGFIDIDPGDGDQITAIASHKDDLWVFKGPYKGSIHRIVGSAPTGGDSFGRQTFVRGLGAASHNTLFRFRDDLGFMWSDGSIHSLNATAAFGDFNEAALSRPINGWLKDNINGNRFEFYWAATDSVRGYVLFTIATGTSTNNDHHLLMDYRFNPVRWSHWNAFTSGVVATVVDSGIPTLFDGSNDGFVRRLQRSDRTVDATDAISCRTDTPCLNYGTPHNMKMIERASVGILPKGAYDLTFGWTRDSNAEQTQTVGQGQTGSPLGTFVLDIDRLGGSTFQNRFLSLEEGGEFRCLNFSVRNSGLSEDLEVHSIAATMRPGADSGEN